MLFQRTHLPRTLSLAFHTSRVTSQNPNSNFCNKTGKPSYSPPSSLDRSVKKPVRSDLPFDFRFSYTNATPSDQPVGLRQPMYSPFGPDRVDRDWTGICAPFTGPESDEERIRKRDRILGRPLNEAEVKILVDSCHRRRTRKQVNLGRDGLTHNMLNDIHNHWKHVHAVRIKCMGLPTVDMKNVSFQIEDKTGGKIIHRHGGLLILYRGRNYHPNKRPVIPLMLWKPQDPIYSKLIKSVIDGLTIEETKEMRKNGLAVPALTRLAKNGYYGSLVRTVRDAFSFVELVRIDCQGLEKSDYKKIGCKLRDLVPCVVVTFDSEQIVVWRGKDYRPAEDLYQDLYSGEE